MRRDHDVTCVVASPDVVLRRGLRSIIQEHHCGVISEARTPRETLETAMRLRPDVVVLAVSSAIGDALRVLPMLTKFTRVVVMSHRGSGVSCGQVRDHGAAAFLVHDEYTAADLVGAVVDVARARTPGAPDEPLPLAISSTLRAQLSPRQAQVMDCVAEGMDNNEIARVLALQVKTVKNHINHIFAKLGVRTRAQAIVRWLASTAPSTTERAAG